MLAYTRRVAGERDDWRRHVIGLLLACGQTAWRITSATSQRHGGKCVCMALRRAKHIGVNAACRW